MTVLSNTAAVVGNDEIDWWNFTQEFWIDVDQDLYGDYTGALFEIDASYSRLRLVTYNIDEGSDWYIVQPGEQFTASGIRARQYPTLKDDYLPPTPVHPYPSIDIDFDPFTSGEFFYLGYATSDTHRIPPHYDRDVFGWIKIGVTPPWDGFSSESEMYVIESAAAFNAAGIVVGTTTGIEIPEPASWMLAAAAVCGLWLTYRRARTADHQCRRVNASTEQT